MSLAQDLADAVDAVSASDVSERERQQANSDLLNEIINSLKANPSAAETQSAIAKLVAVKAASDATLAAMPAPPAEEPPVNP
jgi:hypothetical protein